MSRLRRPAAVVVGVAATALAFVPIPLLTSGAAAAAAPTPTTVTTELDCNLPAFNAPFDWTATITATAIGDGAETSLNLSFNDMPGVSPVPVNNQPMSGTVITTVDGTAVTLTGTENITAAANAPVPVPDVAGKFASTATSIVVGITKADFVVAGIEIKCVPETTADVGAVAVEAGAVPTPTPTPTATVTPTVAPTTEATKSQGKKAASKAVPASGTVSFDCKLQTLGSPFTYKPTIKVFGSRESAEDKNVSLWAEVTNIPGLAPVPIENNPMKITMNTNVGGKDVTFTGSSTVNAATKAEVPVPRLTASTSSSESELDVTIIGFKFDFGTISGLTVYSECGNIATKIGALTVGVGKEATKAAAAAASNSSSGGSSLPGTGAGAPLAAIALWAAALGLFGAAAMLLLPGRRRARSTA